MGTGILSMSIVQIALSVVISWALFALMCSMVQEFIVQLKSERGRFFRTKIFEKLYDSSNQINWGLQMYNHSNIKLLTKSSEAPPSTISSKMLAETLIDSVSFSHANQILKNNAPKRTPNFKSDLLNDLEFGVNNLGQSDVIMMLKNYLSKAKVTATTANGYDEEKLYKSLIEDLQIWFDEFGDRTSRWYKKTSQKRLFFLGILIATATNIDSLALISFFKENPAAQKQMETFYLNNQKELERLNAQYNEEKDAIKEIDSVKKETNSTVTDTTRAVVGDGNANATVTDTASTAVDSASASLEKEKKKTKEDIKALASKIDSLKTKIDLPIGWDKAICVTTKKEDPKCKCPKSTFPPMSCILLKILGILISALAASLGAPFWFDLLKRATTMNIIKK